MLASQDCLNSTMEIFSSRNVPIWRILTRSPRSRSEHRRLVYQVSLSALADLSQFIRPPDRNFEGSLYQTAMIVFHVTGVSACFGGAIGDLVWEQCAEHNNVQKPRKSCLRWLKFARQAAHFHTNNDPHRPSGGVLSADHSAAFIHTNATRAEQIELLNTGSGFIGASLEYLQNVVNQFAALGIAGRSGGAYRGEEGGWGLGVMGMSVSELGFCCSFIVRLQSLEREPPHSGLSDPGNSLQLLQRPLRIDRNITPPQWAWRSARCVGISFDRRLVTVQRRV